MNQGLSMWHVSTAPMLRRLAVSLVATAIIMGGVESAVGAAPAVEPSGPWLDAKAPDFRGVIEIFNCSAALVRWPSSESGDVAMMLTNGHCYQPSDKASFTREVIVDRRDNRPVTLLARDGSDLATLRASRVLYSTAYRTDVGLYRLRLTYAQIRQRFHIRALTIAETRPAPKAEVLIPSGFSREVYSCTLNGSAYKLYNDDFHWRHSLRYLRDPSCHTIHGTSGSPIIDPHTRAVLGVNNAINAQLGGGMCVQTLCEETKRGRVSVHVHRRYGQQTWWLTTCVAPDRSLDLDKAGCKLPKPPA